MKMHRNIFAIDFIGAIVSFLLMYFVVAGFPSFFGLEPKIAKGISVFPVFFFVYSCLTYFFVKDPLKLALLLQGIITANLLYCLLTFIVLIRYFPFRDLGDRLTLYGVIYLILEILVIISLVTFEYRILRSIKESYDG